MVPQAMTELTPSGPILSKAASSSTYGGIEAGGTKWVCAIGKADGRLIDSRRIPTTTPEETIARAAQFFRERGTPATIGVGSFGPLDLRSSSPTSGYITTTPKPGWANTDLVGALEAALDATVILDTDVNAAALGELRWGAGVGLETFTYVTIGTGIGGGSIVNGRLPHGMSHSELGHIRIPRDHLADPFGGSCPYHGDCLEGLASGEALRLRWGRSAETIDPSHPAWPLEANYLALALMNLICTLSPQRIVLGGGLMKQTQLLPMVRRRLHALLGGYIQTPELTEPDAIDAYIVPAALEDRAGAVGAIELARMGEGMKTAVSA